MTNQNKDRIQLAINALEYLAYWQQKDGSAVVNEVAEVGLKALRAIQSQPAAAQDTPTNGLDKVRDVIRIKLEEYNACNGGCDFLAGEIVKALAILDQQAAHNPTTTIPAGWKLVPVEAVVRLNAISKQWSVDEIKHNEKYEDCDFESGYDEMVKNIREIQSILSAAPDLNGEG